MYRFINIVIILTSMLFPMRSMASVSDSAAVVTDTVAVESLTGAVAVTPAGEGVIEAAAVSGDIDTAGILRRLSDTDYKLGGSVRREGLTLYDLPYSRTLSMPDWKKLWLNTGILMSAGVATMVVLEALPADATAWNKTENAKVSLFKRWWRNVHKGPVWDGDNLVFNYVLHPYAGAAYYMGARSNGFNCWGSFLYTFCISSFFWEYGFEAFNEIPSIQDLIVTPVVGSILGEGFYMAKRAIVNRGYSVCGSKAFGYVLAFLLDPLNEVTGYFSGYQGKLSRRADERRAEKERTRLEAHSWLSPSRTGIQGGFTLTYTF